MKIEGKLDIAIWFDMLSILEIKYIRTSGDKRKKAFNAWTEMKENLEKQLSIFMLNEILISQEYKNLLNANDRVFCAVDLAEDINSGITAYEVAQLNLLRYNCKKILQEKFFDEELTEIKTGEYNV